MTFEELMKATPVYLDRARLTPASPEEAKRYIESQGFTGKVAIDESYTIYSGHDRRILLPNSASHHLYPDHFYSMLHTLADLVGTNALYVYCKIKTGKPL